MEEQKRNLGTVNHPKYLLGYGKRVVEDFNQRLTIVRLLRNLINSGPYIGAILSGTKHKIF